MIIEHYYLGLTGEIAKISAEGMNAIKGLMDWNTKSQVTVDEHDMKESAKVLDDAISRGKQAEEKLISSNRVLQRTRASLVQAEAQLVHDRKVERNARARLEAIRKASEDAGALFKNTEISYTWTDTEGKTHVGSYMSHDYESVTSRARRGLAEFERNHRRSAEEYGDALKVHNEQTEVFLASRRI